jgi:2-haloacid dehalogenase
MLPKKSRHPEKAVQQPSRRTQRRSSREGKWILPKRDIVIFDVGGVLLDWNPRHLYRKLFPGDEAAMEDFLGTVCTAAWNRGQDAGRPCADGCALLKREYPEKAALIDAYYDRFAEMIPGPVEGSIDILAELHARDIPLYFLSNHSAETWRYSLGRFPFSSWFAGGIVSGEHGVLKPDPAIYRLLLDRYAIDPYRAVFIDDSALNAEGGRSLGIHGIHFTSAPALRAELAALGLL